VQTHYKQKKGEAGKQSGLSLLWQSKRDQLNKYLLLYRDELDIKTAAAIIAVLDQWDICQFLKFLRQPEAFNCPLYGLKLGLLDRSFMIRNSANELFETWIMPQALKI
jgi:hypothetical protein